MLIQLTLADIQQILILTWNSIYIFTNFQINFTELSTDKITSVKNKETNQPISPNVDKVERKQGAIPRAALASSHNLLPQTPRIPQPKTDATDRRYIEAQNEDKSHTTKETLDGIKHVHYKEKKKKEQSNSETYQTGTDFKVRNIIVLYGKIEGIVKSFTSGGLRSNPPRAKEFKSLQF